MKQLMFFFAKCSPRWISSLSNWGQIPGINFFYFVMVLFVNCQLSTVNFSKAQGVKKITIQPLIGITPRLGIEHAGLNVSYTVYYKLNAHFSVGLTNNSIRFYGIKKRNINRTNYYKGPDIGQFHICSYSQDNQYDPEFLNNPCNYGFDRQRTKITGVNLKLNAKPQSIFSPYIFINLNISQIVRIGDQISINDQETGNEIIIYKEPNIGTTQKGLGGGIGLDIRISRTIRITPIQVDFYTTFSKVDVFDNRRLNLLTFSFGVSYSFLSLK
ncbi:MAG: hypothetical protein IIA88_06660 [Bacteroidetes bacterium]|nr:hypothetical protein [Bacteroidota bacterium]